MGKLTKNYIYNVIFQIITLLLPLVLSPYLARVLGAKQLGIYSFVTSGANVIVTIGLLGTYNYGCREIAYYRDNINKLRNVYNQIYTLRNILGIILSMVYLLWSVWQKEYMIYCLLYYTWVLSMIIDPSWFFIGQEDMKWTVIKNSSIKIVTMVFIFLFVHENRGLFIYIGIMGIGALLGNLWLFFQLKKTSIKHRITTVNIKQHLKGALALFWPQAASLFYLQIDKIMLGYLSGDISNVSYYDYGEKIVTIPLALITILSTVMMPRIANEYAKKNIGAIRALLIKTGSFSLMFAMPMMLGMAVCANKLIPWYLGNSYSPTISVILLLSPMIITNALSGISGNQYLVATNQTSILLKAYVSAALINVCVNVVLIPRFGCCGAAIATIVSATISIVIQYYYMNKQIGVKEYLSYGVKYFVCSIPVGIVVFLIGWNRKSAPIVSLIQVIVGCTVYGIVLIVIKDPNLFMVINKFRGICKK